MPVTVFATKHDGNVDVIEATTQLIYWDLPRTVMRLKLNPDESKTPCGWVVDYAMELPKDISDSSVIMSAFENAYSVYRNVTENSASLDDLVSGGADKGLSLSLHKDPICNFIMQYVYKHGQVNKYSASLLAELMVNFDLSKFVNKERPVETFNTQLKEWLDTMFVEIYQQGHLSAYALNTYYIPQAHLKLIDMNVEFAECDAAEAKLTD